MNECSIEELKSRIIKKIDELVDAAEQNGSIDYFEINIMHTKRDLSIQLINKYKEKV